MQAKQWRKKGKKLHTQGWQFHHKYCHVFVKITKETYQLVLKLTLACLDRTMELIWNNKPTEKISNRKLTILKEITKLWMTWLLSGTLICLLSIIRHPKFMLRILTKSPLSSFKLKGIWYQYTYIFSIPNFSFTGLSPSFSVIITKPSIYKKI